MTEESFLTYVIYETCCPSTVPLWKANRIKLKYFLLCKKNLKTKFSLLCTLLNVIDSSINICIISHSSQISDSSNKGSDDFSLMHCQV